jgi:hypothetical protein
MSRASVRRLEIWLQSDMDMPGLDTGRADLRAVLALAKRAVADDDHLALMTPCPKTRHPVRDCACRDCERKRAALAPRNEPTRAKRKPMFTPEQERIIRECEAGDETPGLPPTEAEWQRWAGSEANRIERGEPDSLGFRPRRTKPTRAKRRRG